MRELYINMEYRTGAHSYILKWCQEPHFNYCTQYSLQIWRAYRYGGAPYSRVVRFTEQHPHIRISAPFRFQYVATEHPQNLHVTSWQSVISYFPEAYSTTLGAYPHPSRFSCVFHTVFLERRGHHHGPISAFLGCGLPSFPALDFTFRACFREIRDVALNPFRGLTRNTRYD